MYETFPDDPGWPPINFFTFLILFQKIISQPVLNSHIKNDIQKGEKDSEENIKLGTDVTR